MSYSGECLECSLFVLSATFDPGISLPSTARHRTCVLQLNALILDGGMNPLGNVPATRLRSSESGTDGVLSKDSRSNM